MTGRRRGSLDAVELAEAAVFADLAIALLAASFFLPFGLVFFIAAMAPFGVVAARRRARAVLVMAFVSIVLSAIVLGPSGPGNMALDAGCGAVVGAGLRRGWRSPRIVASGTPFVWVPGAVLTLGSLAVFDTARHLVFAQMRAVADGMGRLLLGAEWPRRFVDAVIDHWVLVFALGELVVVVTFVAAALAVTRPLTGHLTAALRDPMLLPPDGPGTAVEPVPVRLQAAAYRYPGAAADALPALTYEIPAGGLVAVVGPNGVGKSTLGMLLAGLPPTSGRLERPGAAGLGHRGGTAVVGQRPESQVLGVRVRDDVVWGLPPGEHPDVDALLVDVGLGGFAERETATLSGGQLQRLAVAGALARRPHLLVSDESTSMLDPEGRAAVMDVLRRVADRGVTVVHITHRPEDVSLADRVLWLGGAPE